LIAWLVTHGASGIMTFVIYRAGVNIPERSPHRNGRAPAIKFFDPGLDWARVAVGPEASSH